MNIIQPFLAKAGATVKGALRVLSTGAARMPVGTTAERPAIEDGLIRYNTTLQKWEQTVDGAWTQGISDAQVLSIVQASATLILNTPTLNNAAINNSAISNPALTTGTSSGMAIATATINNSTISGTTINTSTVNSPTLNTPTLINPVINELVLTDAETTVWDTNLGHVARWLINATGRNLSMTNTKVGGNYVLILGLMTPSTQTPTWPANWKWQYDVVPNLTTSNWTIITLQWSVHHNKFLAMAGPGF